MSKIISNTHFTLISNSLVETNSPAGYRRAIALFGEVLARVHREALRLLADTLAVHHRYRDTAFARPKKAILEDHYKDMFLDIYQIEQLVNDVEQISGSDFSSTNYTGSIVEYKKREKNLKQALENLIEANKTMCKTMKHMQLWAKTIGHHQCDFFAQHMRQSYEENIKGINQWMVTNKKYMDKFLQ